MLLLLKGMFNLSNLYNVASVSTGSTTLSILSTLSTHMQITDVSFRAGNGFLCIPDHVRRRLT